MIESLDANANSSSPDETALAATLPDQFAVVDIRSANWVVEKVTQARATAARAKEWAEQIVEEAKRREQFFLQRFGPQLETIARAEQEASHKKSLKLPAGTIGFRARPLGLHVESEEAAVCWAKRECPQAVTVMVKFETDDARQLDEFLKCLNLEYPQAQVTEKLNKSAVNSHFDRTGEVPDGMTLDGGDDVFYIR